MGHDSNARLLCLWVCCGTERGTGAIPKGPETTPSNKAGMRGVMRRGRGPTRLRSGKELRQQCGLPLPAAHCGQFLCKGEMPSYSTHRRPPSRWRNEVAPASSTPPVRTLAPIVGQLKKVNTSPQTTNGNECPLVSNWMSLSQQSGEELLRGTEACGLHHQVLALISADAVGVVRRWKSCGGYWWWSIDRHARGESKRVLCISHPT